MRRPSWQARENPRGPLVGDAASPASFRCLSVSRLLPGGGRLAAAARGIRGDRGSGAGAEERRLREFLDLMLGSGGAADWTAAEATRGPGGDSAADLLSPGGSKTAASSSGGRGDGLCLEELTAEVARSAVLKAAAARGGARGSDDPGVAHVLRPYLEDLVTRRQGFGGAVDLVASAADVDSGAPKVLTEITAKDLFLALALATPRPKRQQLATAYVSLRAPLPFVFRVADCGASSEIRTVVDFDALHQLACVPRPSRQLILSLGTEQVVGAGKTTLLGALALTPTAEEDLDIWPSGPMHANSADLLCADPGRWVVDVHGHWAGAGDDLRTAMLALIIWGKAACFVHCALGDFHPKTGAPRKELVSLLTAVTSAGASEFPAPGANAAAQQGRAATLLVLVRDASAETFAGRRAAIEAALRPFNPQAVLPVEDCRGFRSAARRASVLERLRTPLEEALASVAGGATTPSLDDLHLVHRGLLEGSRKKPAAAAPSQLGSALPPDGDHGLGARPSRLGEELLGLLNGAQQNGLVASTLLPLSALHQRLLTLRRQEGTTPAGPQDGASASGGSRGAAAVPAVALSARSGSGAPTRLEQLRLEEDQARARAEEVQRLEKQLEAMPCSRAVLFFNRVATSSSRDAFTAVTEFGFYLEQWKEPRVLKLMERQRELLDSLEGQAAGGPPPEGGEGTAKAELKGIAEELVELDFSTDSFWAELELVVARQERRGAAGDDKVDVAKARACWQSLLAEAYPVQILHGRPLQMAGSFLKSVLEAIGAPSQSDCRGLFVVSVIGAQSSAKSTLLNFLFGCSFAVKAGRCTRGLYASYFGAGAGRHSILVLDSEGLLSLGSEGGVFDGQIALMCMTCSHLVLVNHKGELSRQLQDLLEVCLFAMRHLRLARLQPRLAFVLRDQHDRARTVHEDMLKHMRSHLEDAARTLGSPLHDLILLDGTAVFLLPSAVTSELRQGQEVCWTSELFAREVLHLRSEIFRWLNEDSARRAGRDGADGPVEFSSLAHWYDYAAAVWETLDQFGEQLLHYRTIHEIEVRRELADVVKSAVRDALDGTGGSTDADVAPHGFHARARLMVDSFVARMHASPSRFDLETADMELSRALACLRDECVAHLEELFQQRASSPRYSATAKEQAKQQIRTPVEWAYENHIYTWKLHLKKASDERAMHELWVHFTGVLNRHLAGSGHRSCLSEAESKDLFETEWRAYESSFLSRLRTLTKDWQSVAHEVTLLFNHTVGKMTHESGALALLKEIGPQQVALHPEGRREAGLASITEQTDDEWEEQYFYMGWWGTMKMHGLALLQSGGKEAASSGQLRQNIIPRMRQLVAQGLQQFRTDVRSRGVLDEATAADGLRHLTGVVLNDMETRLLAESAVNLKRPQMLHALHVAWRVSCVEALVAVESDKQKKAMSDLLAQKAFVEEHFLLIVQANKGDVERATNFATLYHRSLQNWVGSEVTNLATDVRTQVLQEMPDPQKSSERAFQLSFAAESWPDVLEYVLDMNAYLEKLYLTVFHQRKRSYVGAARSRVEKRVFSAYRLLQDIIAEWVRTSVTSPAGSALPSVGLDVGLTANKPGRSVKELKDFITTHAERVPPTADTAEAHRQLAERLPATADFQIADCKLFAETLQARIGDFADSPEIPKALQEMLDRALREQSVQAWSLIRGCSERCPLCGSKCDLVGEHARHHCAHHLFPAFHGWMDRSTGLPSFNHCLGKETRDGTYKCKDGCWRTLDEYFASDHPAWLPFLSGDNNAAAESDLQHLRAAWVNCREPLLEYFSPMADDCPEEWRVKHDTGRGLTRKDLQSAKDTIRKLRNHTWTPPDT